MRNKGLRICIKRLRIYIKRLRADIKSHKEMLEFAINDFIKNINFAINKIKAVEVVFNELFSFIIMMNKHNNITLFDYEYTTFFIYYVINNQIEFNCI